MKKFNELPTAAKVAIIGGGVVIAGGITFLIIDGINNDSVEPEAEKLTPSFADEEVVIQATIG